MSYKLLTDTISGIDTLLKQVRDALPITGLTDNTITSLNSNGQVVQITPASGAIISGASTLDVWCSCEVQDNPNTPSIEFFACMIAVKAGSPWMKANGMPVGTYLWHAFPADFVASVGLGPIRKGLLLFLAGETQVNNPPIIEDTADTIRSHLSIITRANAAWQLEQAQTGAFS